MANLGAAVAQAAARLVAGPHPERARLDAEALLLYLTEKNRAWLLAHGNDQFSGRAAINYAALVERRACGEPIQYIIGSCEFYGLPFRVTRDVLIPRAETEHLVETALALASTLSASSIRRSLPNGWEATNAELSPRVLDVGTGSGAIAVALAYGLPQAHVTAIDVSPAALQVARGNAELNGVAQRIRFVESDLLSAVCDERFDLIVSNPPYVPEVDRATLAVEVREHEPALALFAGEDGLAVYRRLVPAAARALGPGGRLILEIGYGQAESVRRLIVASGFSDPAFIPDLQGVPRVVLAKIQQATFTR